MSEEVKTKPKSKKSTTSHKKSVSSKKSASGTPKKAAVAVEAHPPPEDNVPAQKPPIAESPILPSLPDLPPSKQPVNRYPQPRAFPLLDRKDPLPPVTESTLAQLAQRQLTDQPPAKHEPLSPPEFARPQQALPSVCPLHNQTFRYFCEACEEPICPECQLAGPHNTELHRVSGLQDAFVPRFGYVTSQLYTELLRKRDVLLGQIGRVDYRIGEIRTTCKSVERGIKSEYVETLERLKSAQGGKLAVLQHDIAELQKDVERIDLILKVVDDYTQGDLRNDYIGFLGKFKEVHEYMEYAVTKPFKTTIDTLPNDLPRDLTERRNLLQRADQSEGLLKLKDDIMWNLIQDNKRIGSLGEEEVARFPPAKNLFGKYSYELMSYELVCAYCGTALDEFSANTACDRNTEDFKAEVSDKFTIEDPPLDLKGTARHFFAASLKKQRLFPQKVLADSVALVAYNAIKAGGRRIFAEIWKKLQQADPGSRFVLPPASLVAILRPHYDVPPESIERLVLALVPPTSASQGAYYKDFVRHFDAVLTMSPEVQMAPGRRDEARKETFASPTRAAPQQFQFQTNATVQQAQPTMLSSTAAVPPLQTSFLLSPPASAGAMPAATTMFNGMGRTAGSSVLYGGGSTTGFAEIVDKKPKLSERETDAEMVKALVGSMKRKDVKKKDLKARFKRYDESGKGIVPLDVFYVIFMRLNFVLTNKEVELMARHWDPEVLTKKEINYRQFLKKFYKEK